MRILIMLGLLCLLPLTGCVERGNRLVASSERTLPPVPARCVVLQCLESDGCWYDRQAQVVHHQRVDLICVPAK